uniref:Uncharacterized protein n=1 Tax=Parascaris univalens TaxID=6257 RepID=A0A915B778_PARUN
MLNFEGIQFQWDPDWWIYVPLYALGAALCIVQVPKSGIWRLLSAIVIVLGGLHVAFIAWSIRHASRAVLAERFYEARYIALCATSVAMVTSARLRTGEYKNIFAYLRTMILLVVLLSTIPALMFSTCFYVGKLPYCSYMY